ncbi:MAG: hypothetical protein D6743_17770 [Calditrichaeota bacterium]|nr:MAG: hypothetical protein D6743_17770 [Calditrichota bacterium]
MNEISSQCPRHLRGAGDLLKSDLVKKPPDDECAFEPQRAQRPRRNETVLIFIKKKKDLLLEGWE